MPLATPSLWRLRMHTALGWLFIGLSANPRLYYRMPLSYRTDPIHLHLQGDHYELLVANQENVPLSPPSVVGEVGHKRRMMQPSRRQTCRMYRKPNPNPNPHLTLRYVMYGMWRSRAWCGTPS